MALPLLDDEAEAALAAALSFVDAYGDPCGDAVDLRELVASHALALEACYRPSLAVGGHDGGGLSVPSASPAASLSDSSDEPKPADAQLLALKPESHAMEELVADEGELSGGAVGSKRRASAKNHRNGAREERLRELRQLRSRVAEMEQQLQALQVTHTNRQRRRVGHTAGSDEIEPRRRGSPAEAAAVWKDLAARQLEQRLTSEGENRRLKMMVERQQKVTRALEKVLQSRATKETMDACSSGKRSRRVHAIPADMSDPESFQRLLTLVERAYAEVDQASQSVRQHSGADGTFLGVFADKTLPFAVPDTGAAVWQLLAHNAEQSEYRYYFQKDSPTHGTTPEDIVVERFGVEIHSESVSGDFNIRQVFRRYIEPERIVVVWRSFIDPIEFKKVPLAGVRFSEKGYIVVKRPAALPDFSLLQTWYIVTPETPADTFPELTEFVLNGSATARAVQVIENILLRRSMNVSA